MLCGTRDCIDKCAEEHHSLKGILSRQPVCLEILIVFDKLMRETPVLRSRIFASILETRLEYHSLGLNTTNLWLHLTIGGQLRKQVL